ncbi:MAG: hypothetical protein DIZ80_00110 [endosymbiont of Galathealinum brachiosum]|uniref:Uncharacterized protein n=1 Tax=endosymbiont of Galathealinum brachiosum TaxID=2200906 RepID=A0A370DLX3_9GAMM|nr:MAG: hypothetical protein DIZ80_00110 [endosymbiont of Galathealinum brachiosum]
MIKTLCPFSKPIIGNWCKCQYANLDDRCAGKMTCLQADDYISDCYDLVDVFKEQSRFILGLNQHEQALTHMQLMKIRCGGLLGMQRILSDQLDEVPDVLGVKHLAEQKYGDVSNFPFNEIVRDIKDFTHRKKRG